MGVNFLLLLTGLLVLHAVVTEASTFKDLEEFLVAKPGMKSNIESRRECRSSITAMIDDEGYFAGRLNEFSCYIRITSDTLENTKLKMTFVGGTLLGHRDKNTFNSTFTGVLDTYDFQKVLDDGRQVFINLTEMEGLFIKEPETKKLADQTYILESEVRYHMKGTIMTEPLKEIHCGNGHVPVAEEEAGVKIINGKQFPNHQYPWIAYITSDDEDTMVGSDGCGGALVNRAAVVTATVCVKKKGKTMKSSSLSVLVGIHGKSTIKELIKHKVAAKHSVEEIEIFPETKKKHECKSKIMGNVFMKLRLQTIAVLKLKYSIQLDYFRNIICLKTPQLKIGDMILIIGWGEGLAGEVDPKGLPKEITPSLMGNQECLDCDMAQEMITINEHILCASPMISQMGVGVCSGDAGGPWAIKDKDGQYVLVGVTAYRSRAQGEDKCMPMQLNLGANALPLVPWIKKQADLPE